MRLGRNTPWGGTGTLACADVAALRMPHSQEWLCHMTAARALRSRRTDGGSPKARTFPWCFFWKCGILPFIQGCVILLLAVTGCLFMPVISFAYESPQRFSVWTNGIGKE